MLRPGAILCQGVLFFSQAKEHKIMNCGVGPAWNPYFFS